MCFLCQQYAFTQNRIHYGNNTATIYGEITAIVKGDSIHQVGYIAIGNDSISFYVLKEKTGLPGNYIAGTLVKFAKKDVDFKRSPPTISKILIEKDSVYILSIQVKKNRNIHTIVYAENGSKTIGIKKSAILFFKNDWQAETVITNLK